MVASLPADPAAVASLGVSLGSPCIGTFLPVYLDATVPEALGVGGGAPDPRSPWWRMRELLDLVERDFAAFGPTVRARWDAFESSTWCEAEQVEREAARREGPERAGLLGDFSARAVAAWLSEIEAVIALVR
jgi:dipeptidase